MSQNFASSLKTWKEYLHSPSAGTCGNIGLFNVQFENSTVIILFMEPDHEIRRHTATSILLTDTQYLRKPTGKLEGLKVPLSLNFLSCHHVEKTDSWKKFQEICIIFRQNIKHSLQRKTDVTTSTVGTIQIDYQKKIFCIKVQNCNCKYTVQYPEDGESVFLSNAGTHTSVHRDSHSTTEHACAPIWEPQVLQH